MNKATPKVLIAGVFATAGVVAVVWSWGLYPRARNSSAPPVADSANSLSFDDLPYFSQRVSPEFTTYVNPDNLAHVAGEIRSRAASIAQSTNALSSLTVASQDALFDAVEEQTRVYLGASFDGYKAFMRRAGGRRAYIDEAGDDPDALAAAWATVERIWTSMAEPIAFKPVSLDDVVVRMRYRQGTPIPTPDDRYAKVVFNRPDAWPELSGEPGRNGYTIVELMIPVFYHRETVATPVYFGIWFVHDDKAGDWKIHQTRLYEPALTYNLVCPSF